jgi:hypothetical protein
MKIVKKLRFLFIPLLLLTIALTSLSYTNSAHIEAAAQKPTTTVTKKTLSVGGGNYQINCKYLASNAKVTYQSSNKSIVTVSNKGSVKPVAKGSAVVTVTIVQNKKKYTSKIAFTVVQEAYPAFDMGGRTIKVGTWFDYYYTSDHYDIKDDPIMDNAVTAQLKLDNIRRIEKKYNCKIQFINMGWEGVQNSIKTSIPAGKPECDIYLTDISFGIPAVIKGYAQDLTDFAPSTSDIFGKQSIIKTCETKGGTYLFREQCLPVNGIFLGYNADMIKELGLKDPQTLYKEGKWTWEKFAEYAQAGTTDRDGDGTTDVYGFGGLFSDLTYGLVLNNGGSIVGSQVESLSSKPVREVLEFVSRLYNIDQSARPWQDDWNDNLFAWTKGKALFWTAQAWSCGSYTTRQIEGAKDINYRIVPYPVGPSGNGTINAPVNGNWYFIPKGVTKPSQVFQVFEEFTNWYGNHPEYRDLENKNYLDGCFQTDKDAALCIECSINQKLDYWPVLGSGFDFYQKLFMPIVADHRKDIANLVDSNRKDLQKAIDAFFNSK